MFKFELATVIFKAVAIIYLAQKHFGEIFKIIRFGKTQRHFNRLFIPIKLHNWRFALKLIFLALLRRYILSIWLH